MEIEYVGGPADGRTEPWDGPLPESMYVKRRAVARFVKEHPTAHVPMRRDYRYKFAGNNGGVARYVYVKD